MQFHYLKDISFSNEFRAIPLQRKEVKEAIAKPKSASAMNSIKELTEAVNIATDNQTTFVDELYKGLKELKNKYSHQSFRGKT